MAGQVRQVRRSQAVFIGLILAWLPVFRSFELNDMRIIDEEEPAPTLATKIVTCRLDLAGSMSV
jgi:hypothetical protein